MHPTPIRESTEVIGDIYSFTTITDPEAKDWNGTYAKVIETIEQSGQVHGHFVATAITSDDLFKGYQTAVVIKYDLTMAQSLADIRGGGCCGIF